MIDDGGVFTSETVACQNATANGMHFLPAAPAVNDAVYFGSGSQFDKLIVIIGTAGDWTGTIAWEYYTGSAWTALSGLSDGTSAFEAAAGSHDVTFTVPTNWAITSINNLNAYWVRARVATYSAIVTRPLGSGTTSNSKTYDLHGLTCSGESIYVDSVLKTGGGTDYTFVSGGGGAGGDRIQFASYPATGSLITSDFTGYLRIKGRFGEDELSETMVKLNCISLKSTIQEVQW
jgi:hypothetical protein